MAQIVPNAASADPLIDEIRQYRAELDKRFAGDWAAYGEFIRQSAADIRKEFAIKSVDVHGKSALPGKTH